jgi:hypothetical protein
LAVDDNLSGITLAGEDIQGNSTFTYRLGVSGLSLGEFKFAFYVVSLYGFVSSPLVGYIEVVEMPPSGQNQPRVLRSRTQAMARSSPPSSRQPRRAAMASSDSPSSLE